MSLDVDTTKVSRVECWTHHGRDRELTPICRSLAWASMTLDLGILSPRSVDEWYFRIVFCHQINWPWAQMSYTEASPSSVRGSHSTVRGTNVVRTPYWPDYQDLLDHCGLHTNVSKVERRAWMRKMMKRSENEVLRLIENQRRIA